MLLFDFLRTQEPTITRETARVPHLPIRPKAKNLPSGDRMPCGRLSIGLSDRKRQGGGIGICNVSSGSTNASRPRDLAAGKLPPPSRAAG